MAQCSVYVKINIYKVTSLSLKKIAKFIKLFNAYCKPLLMCCFSSA
jgi:hypothetical protein